VAKAAARAAAAGVRAINKVDREDRAAGAAARFRSRASSNHVLPQRWIAVEPDRGIGGGICAR
jgi:hypothetical protein